MVILWHKRVQQGVPQSFRLVHDDDNADVTA